MNKTFSVPSSPTAAARSPHRSSASDYQQSGVTTTQQQSGSELESEDEEDGLALAPEQPLRRALRPTTMQQRFSHMKPTAKFAARGRAAAGTDRPQLRIPAAKSPLKGIRNWKSPFKPAKKLAAPRLNQQPPVPLNSEQLTLGRIVWAQIGAKPHYPAQITTASAAVKAGAVQPATRATVPIFFLDKNGGYYFAAPNKLFDYDQYRERFFRVNPAMTYAIDRAEIILATRSQAAVVDPNIESSAATNYSA